MNPVEPGTAPSPRSRVKRAAERAHYDATTIHPILDTAWVCHVAFAAPDPLCIPTACWRIGDKLYIHGSNGSRMMKHLASGAAACVTVTHLDGLVMARSAFSHSMNYRSVVIHGAFEVVEEADKAAVLDAFMDHIAQGRRHDVRAGDDSELRATTILAIGLHEAAAKVRDSGPQDKEEDLGSDAWAGVLPMREQHLPAQTDGTWSGVLPDYVKRWNQQV